ncbi:MAG: hypothetical protein JWP74_4205 [Marmoricola sp.]|nr:hypothetical protein [Marmoricola sp.]
MSAGDVTTFFRDGAWTYEVEGEEPLGHHFDAREPAIAGGRFLANERAALHIIKNEDGTVHECHSYERSAAVTHG